MKVSQQELIAEYGGKLLSCEKVLLRSLDKLAMRDDAIEHQELAQESVKTLGSLRARYNLVLQAHQGEVVDILQGLESPESTNATIELSGDQAWVLDSIEDMYKRLSNKAS